MPTNKKKKGSAAAATAAAATTTAAAAAAAKKEKRDALRRDPKEQEEESAASGFTGAQLAGLIYLSIAATYLIDFYKVLKEGIESEACVEWVPSVESCSEVDLWMVQTKFDTGLITMVLVAGTMLFVCWNDEGLFLRLNSFLCSTPMITTLMAVHTSSNLCHPGKLFRLSSMCTILLALSAGMLYKAKLISLPQHPQFNLQEATLLTLIAAFGWETYKMFRGGVPGYFRIDKDQVSTPGHVLAAFVAVDQATITAILLFSLLFLKEKQQRTVLSFVAILQGAMYYLLFPKLRGYLLEQNYYESFLSGTAMFSMTASFAPEVTLFGTKHSEDTAEGEEVKTTEEKDN